MKVGVALTAHKTVTMFMKYVHTEDDPVRVAAETVNQRRQVLRGGPSTKPPAPPIPALVVEVPSVAPEVAAIEPAATARGKPLGFEDDQYISSTKLGNYTAGWSQNVICSRHQTHIPVYSMRHITY